MTSVSRGIDRIDVTFDDPNLVANAGLLLVATLVVRLRLERLINEMVDFTGRVGGALPGRKVLTLVHAMVAGGSHIDHADVLRSGATQSVLPHRVMAPSTLGTFLRAFSFGHVRQLDRVLAEALRRAWSLGAGPGDDRLVIDLDSTICAVCGKAKHGAGYGYTNELGYHPLVATRAGTGELLHVRSPLAGEHQRRNLALAIAAALELRNHNGYNITNAAIEAGIANTEWPGRLEFLPPDLLLDVAHNPAGAWALRAAIATLPEDRPRTLLFSCLRDKDLTEMARILFPLFDSAATGPQHHIVFAPIASARAASVDDMLAAAHALDVPAYAAASAEDALALARSLTPPGGLIVATGSVFLVGAIREAAGLRKGAAL